MSNKGIVIAVVVLIVLGLGAGAYFFLKKPKEEDKEEEKPQEVQQPEPEKKGVREVLNDIKAEEAMKRAEAAQKVAQATAVAAQEAVKVAAFPNVLKPGKFRNMIGTKVGNYAQTVTPTAVNTPAVNNTPATPVSTFRDLKNLKTAV